MNKPIPADTFRNGADCFIAGKKVDPVAYERHEQALERVKALKAELARLHPFGHVADRLPPPAS